ncbi:MAG: DUF1415 domain-containing protein [Ferruginibacter sp.]
MNSDNLIIAQTAKWISDVVIGCNFCPFAAREIHKGGVLYTVVNSKDSKAVLESLSRAFDQLDVDTKIETILLLIPEGFQSFSAYLQLLALAESFLQKEGYEGIYQVASFHPEYLFANALHNDPSNYTNRSPYPMLHLLREQSVTLAIENFPGTENIPKNNIKFTKAKGLITMQNLLKACLEIVPKNN